MKSISEEENPWKTLTQEVVYDNPWIKVTEYQVINPSGNPGIYGVVSFKNKAIGIIPLDKDGYIYLVGQYRFPLNEYSWEIVEGGGEIGTDPLESAKRELKEETGLTAGKWTQIGRLHTSNSVTDEESFIYLAENLEQGETDFDDTEQLQIRKLHIKEAVEMVMRNEITDGISVAGILKVARKLNI